MKVAKNIRETAVHVCQLGKRGAGSQHSRALAQVKRDPFVSITVNERYQNQK